jgi:chromatin structure-remodeling complex subunit RSC9
VVTQVEFWNLYKDTFTPYIEKYPLLVASDVIKNVNAVFPSAQAMVLQDPVQRFVVQGVDRRKDSIAAERFRCLWDRSQCPAAPFASASELYDHAMQHLVDTDASESPCLWGPCSKLPLPRSALQLHVLTHLSSTQLPPKPPSQSDTITLSSGESHFPMDNPILRPPPPPRSTVITYEKPMSDPSSVFLTALLVLRILFRTSFASADVAPRADGDHFGFPGIVEDTGDQESEDVRDQISDQEGERRGRKAFAGIRHLLEYVRIQDEVLMGWITEMVDAGTI